MDPGARRIISVICPSDPDLLWWMLMVVMKPELIPVLLLYGGDQV